MNNPETPADGLNFLEVLAEGGSNVAVVCIHGLCCNRDIFRYAASRLSKLGYGVYCIDLPGHGESADQIGDLDFDKTINAIHGLISKIKTRYSRVFLLAHSMGSTFAIWYAHQFKNNVDGLVLLTPYVRIPKIRRSDAEPSAIAFLYMILGRILAPKKRIDIRKVLPGYVRIGGSQYKRMTTLKGVNFQYSFRYLIDVVARRNSALTALPDIATPVLVMYGLQDRNVYPAVSEEYFKMLKSENKKLVALDCNHWYYDAIFYNQSDEYAEADRLAFVQIVADWMAAISQKNTPDP